MRILKPSLYIASYICIGKTCCARVLQWINNYAFKIAYYALEQCSKIKPVMLKIMLRNLNYAHWYCEI